VVFNPELSVVFKSGVFPVAKVDVVPPIVVTVPVPIIGVNDPVDVSASFTIELKFQLAI
jgi:hypothetical protein